MAEMSAGEFALTALDRPIADNGIDGIIVSNRLSRERGLNFGDRRQANIQQGYETSESYLLRLRADFILRDIRNPHATTQLQGCC
jgi:hypothetical protein